MSIYADSSFIIATRVLQDNFHRKALEFYEGREEEVWLWSPWHRIEVFNTIRQLTRHPDSTRSLSQGEAKALIRRLEKDVQLGYFVHLEADWRDVLHTAGEISAKNAFTRPCPAMDFLHIAYAKELAADAFVSFDEDQLSLAAASGLSTINPA